MKGQSLSSGKMRTTIYLPEALHRQAKVYAAEHRTTITELMIEGLKARLKTRPKEDRP